mmetsp:Transcript_17336/g.42346  ORF Transcript_17336/g.42346 Transcript_17336/m.42346 type:complete len:237 (+) Transcript_17336:554-1264(+)
MVPRSHLPRQGTESPPVDLAAVLALVQLLRSHVELCPCPRLGPHLPALLLVLLAAPKVGDGQVAVAVDQQVLRLEVTVHDPAPVQLLKGQRDLARVHAARLHVKRCVVVQHVEELPAGEVVHHNIEPRAALEREMHVDNVGVAQILEDGALRLRALEVVAQNCVLAHALHRVDAARLLAPHLEHLAEPALPNHVQDLEGISVDPRAVGGHGLGAPGGRGELPHVPHAPGRPIQGLC